MRSSATVFPNTLPTARRLADFLELVRPRIAVLILFTVAVGFGLASGNTPDVGRLLNTMFGMALLVAGASALNQVFERQSDAMMERTSNRPLAANRLRPGAALIAGVCLAIAGLTHLALTVRQPVALAFAAFAFATYVFLYTPLKRKTTLNTLIGAISGAVPPVVGWTAVTGSLDPAAAVLFAILFLWQVPHFLAIAWIYRDDYSRAGLRMLPVIDSSGSRTARCMTGYGLALIAVSLMPSILGWTGGLYFLVATVLGVWFAMRILGFARQPSTPEARKVLQASLVYLPILLTVLLVEGVLKAWAGTL